MTAIHSLKSQPTNDVADMRFERAIVDQQIKPDVTEQSGMYSAGMIENVSLISRGEALGHEMWIDQTTLQQVAELGEQSGSVKVRFTHPTMCSDGLGRALGRVNNFRVANDQVIGDLHFFESAHATPEGDLAEYVMMLVEEDPTAAGLSIVFEADLEEQDEFVSRYAEAGKFKSPDENNVKHYTHVRLANLRAADVVDEPAANPTGMFHRDDLRKQISGILSYSLGLSTRKPSTIFGIDPERASAFVQKWMSENNVELHTPTESDMSSEQTEDQAPVDTRETVLQEMTKFTEEFGIENGTKWFQENLSFSEAYEQEAKLLREEVKKLASENAELQTKLSSIQIGEAEPVDVVDSANDTERVDYKSFFKIKQSSN